ncbi:MAG: GDP-mannose 4,6-dehydratase [Thermoanaerobaculum sp.]|nr:GDP-mannose 4,6-dehydratase [Thermoanaerobaculum sp.]MCX7894640.1 GDP-mannose 4,6-dehydratase [Thermoanaerobaculum sp.]MDW7967402.1 GDP-mannose 4,6-dehydratase [Thermoanaerobaculum sp.]
MRTVLVTGGAGFIGSHLTQALLDQGLEVVCLDDFNDYYNPDFKRENVVPFLQHPQYHLVEGDIRDRQVVFDTYRRFGISATVHLAARAGVRPSIAHPRLYEEVNGVGTVNLLEAAHRFGAYTFIFGSTSSVYGINSKVPFAEDDPITCPISPYAASKRGAELMCYTFHHLYGLKVTVLRFFTVYGPRQRPDMAVYKFTELLAQGRPVPRFGDGTTARDYTFIDDIVRGIMAAFTAEADFEIVNLGGSRTTTLQRLIELIARELGVKPLIEELPHQPGDVPITYADISKAKRLWGWEPQIPIEEGIARFVSWFKAHRLASG